MAPLRSLIRQVLDERESFGRVIILYGAREPSPLLFRDELAQWEARDDVELHVTVDRAGEDWTGNVGVATTLFPKVRVNPHSTIAVTVAPLIVYRFALMELLCKGLHDSRIFLSLERKMKCGPGKCGHCEQLSPLAQWTAAESGLGPRSFPGTKSDGLPVSPVPALSRGRCPEVPLA